MEENVITIPVYATMANHLCFPSLHLKNPDSNCCLILGAQKPPLLRRPNQCLPLVLRQKKRDMSQTSLKRRCVYLDVNVCFSINTGKMCFLIYLTPLLHKKNKNKKNHTFKLMHNHERKQHYGRHKHCRQASIKTTEI